MAVELFLRKQFAGGQLSSGSCAVILSSKKSWLKKKMFQQEKKLHER
jgi:hypothetical protein